MVVWKLILFSVLEGLCKVNNSNVGLRRAKTSSVFLILPLECKSESPGPQCVRQIHIIFIIKKKKKSSYVTFNFEMCYLFRPLFMCHKMKKKI